MKSKFMSFPILPIFAGLIISSSVCTSTSFAQETTVSVAVENPVQQAIPGQKVVLIGEIGEISPNEKNRVYADLGALVKEILSDSVKDLTTTESLVGDLKNQVDEVKLEDADVLIISIGRADFAAKTEEAVLQNELKNFVSNVKSEKLKVFIIPSSPSLGAIFTSGLRTVAGESSAEFIPLGMEAGGKPFHESLEEIGVIISAPKSPQNDSSETHPLSSITHRPIVDEEISRMAGQTDDLPTTAILEIPEGEPTVDFSGKKTDAPKGKTYTADTKLDTEQTSDGKRILRKTGAEAYETINMRPLPALKSYKPTIPVPRTNIRVKEPELSRN